MNTTLAILIASTGLSRQEIARELGYSESHTSRTLNQKTPVAPEFRDGLAHLILKAAWPEAYRAERKQRVAA